MEKTKVTVLMPTYNAALYIESAIQSILNQTYTNFELLIFDDGSTDNTTTIINSFKDSRINLFVNKLNLGQGRNYNKGIDIAKGKYIAIMHADDIALPERLEKQVYFLEKNQQYALAGTHAKFIFNDTISNRIFKMPTNSEILPIYSLFYCPFIHPSMMIRTNILRKFYYQEDFIAEDYELWTRILKKYSGVNLDIVLIYYRLHDNNLSNTHNEQQLKDIGKIYQRNLEYIGMPYSEKDLETYLKISPSYQQKITNLELKEIQEKLKMIQRHLISKSTEKENVIKQALGLIWLQTCMKVSYNGFRVFKLFYFQNTFDIKLLPKKDMLFLFSKCIFSHQQLSSIYDTFLNIRSKLGI